MFLSLITLNDSASFLMSLGLGSDPKSFYTWIGERMLIPTLLNGIESSHHLIGT